MPLRVCPLAFAPTLRLSLPFQTSGVYTGGGPGSLVGGSLPAARASARAAWRRVRPFGGGWGGESGRSTVDDANDAVLLRAWACRFRRRLAETAASLRRTLTSMMGPRDSPLEFRVVLNRERLRVSTSAVMSASHLCQLQCANHQQEQMCAVAVTATWQEVMLPPPTHTLSLSLSHALTV